MPSSARRQRQTSLRNEQPLSHGAASTRAEPIGRSVGESSGESVETTPVEVVANHVNLNKLRPDNAKRCDESSLSKSVGAPPERIDAHHQGQCGYTPPPMRDPPQLKRQQSWQGHPPLVVMTYPPHGSLHLPRLRWPQRPARCPTASRILG